jgi:predicted enzyme related to lactoylglutathione lyase
MAAVFRELVIDSADPERLAGFWAEVLGWVASPDEDGDYWVTASGDPEGPGPVLTFLRVPEAKTVKNRLHLDLNPSGCDQATELERLLGLGARRVDVGQADDVSWFVLADPEGNEFCLLERRIDG